MATAVPSIEANDISTTSPVTDGAMAEIPFVPAPLRQAAKTDVIDDAIIVVGQRQKKRKRTKTAGAGGPERSSTPVAVANAKADPDVVPFDFSSAPNILDDSLGNNESEQEENGRAGKRKRPKRGSGMRRLILLLSTPGFY